MLPYDPIIPLLGSYVEIKTYVHKKTHIRMLWLCHLISWVTLSIRLNHSAPQFPLMWNGVNIKVLNNLKGKPWYQIHSLLRKTTPLVSSQCGCHGLWKVAGGPTFLSWRQKIGYGLGYKLEVLAKPELKLDLSGIQSMSHPSPEAYISLRSCFCWRILWERKRAAFACGIQKWIRKSESLPGYRRGC